MSPLQVFYWTHMLYIPFWALLIIHAEVFWYYFLMPGLLFLIEKILGSRLIKKARYGDIYITEVGLLPSGVQYRTSLFVCLLGMWIKSFYETYKLNKS